MGAGEEFSPLTDILMFKNTLNFKKVLKMHIKDAKRVVIKIGSSSLTYENGKPNLRKIEKLARVVSDLKNSGKEIVLVSSGAIAVGVGRLGLKELKSY